MRVVMHRIAWFPFLLSACGHHFDRDRFAAVCSEGDGYSDTAAFDAAASFAGKPVALVKRDAQRGVWWFVDDGIFPPKLAAMGALPVTADNYRDAGLVVCAEQQPGPFARDCDMDSFDATMEVGGGDPKVEVHRTGNRAAPVKAYASHYELSLREAKTGKVLAHESVDVPFAACPSVVLDSNVSYADLPDDRLAAFLAAHTRR